MAFNLLTSLGESARQSLEDVEARILHDSRALMGDKLPVPMLQLVQAPVFHGFGVSLFLELEQPLTAEELMSTLRSEHLDLVSEESDPTQQSELCGAGPGTAPGETGDGGFGHPVCNVDDGG